MADEARLAEHAKHNGGGEEGAPRDRLSSLNGSPGPAAAW